MLNDWKQIDFEGIARQALWTFSHTVEEDYELINERKYKEPVNVVLLGSSVLKPVALLFTDFKEFTQLLEQQATIDQYAEWASSMVNRSISKVNARRLQVKALWFKLPYTPEAVRYCRAIGTDDPDDRTSLN